MAINNSTQEQQDIQQLAGFGIPTPGLSGAEQFFAEEALGAEARGGKYQNPFAGFKLPKQFAGDFWSFYAMAEQFAANTGFRNLLTPKQLLQGLESGIYLKGQNAVFQWMSTVTGAGKTMPWAPTGMNATQYQQASTNLDETIAEMTGASGWAALGLSQTMKDQILENGWTTNTAALTTQLLKQPGVQSKYGWLQFGMTYRDFQNYQTQNHQALTQRYGAKYTTQQAVQNIGAPLTAFHASGGVFGESVPFVAASSSMPTGRQSAIR